MDNLMPHAYITLGADEFRAVQGQKNHKNVLVRSGGIESPPRYTKIMAYIMKSFGLLTLSITTICAKIHDLLSQEILPTDTLGLNEANND